MSKQAELSRKRLTEGPLLSAILRLALPAMGMFYLQAAYNFIDRYWVGHLPNGAEAFAGLSAGMFIIWGTFSLTHLVSIGTGAMVARAIGAGDYKRANHVAAQGLVLGVLVSIFTAVLILWKLDLLFELMGTSPEVTYQGKTYVTVILWGLPLLFLSFVLNSIYQASGDAVTPAKFVAFTIVVNGVLDPILMYGKFGLPAMGVAGAAYATLISRAIWVVGGLSLLRTAKKNILVKVSDFSPLEPRIWARVTLIGLPQCLSGLLFAGVYMALTNLTSAVGTAAVAGLGIGHTAEQITFFAGLGFNVAAATLVGQNLGAGRPGRAARAAWTASGIATVYNTLIGLLFFAAPAFIVRIFVDDPDVVAMGGSYLMILALSQPFMALELVLSGAFSGAGNTVPPMVVQAPLTLARVPLALLFIHWGMGAEGIWWAISLSTVARAILMAAWFSLGRWKRKKV